MGRNPFYVNGEGYNDSTAGKALQNVQREMNRKARVKNMAKKRSCRRTEDENRIHEQAVKLRKMTDEQLVGYVESCKGKCNCKKEKAPKPDIKIDINSILEEIGGIKGIGPAKLDEIKVVLQNRLEVCNG